MPKILGVKFQCKHCEKTYHSTQARSKHAKQQHEVLHTIRKGTRLQGGYPCGTCGLELGSSESLRKHRKRLHLPQEPGEPEIASCEYKAVKAVQEHLPDNPW